MVRLERITVFPIKSLDGVELKSVRITEGGSLEGDRILYLVDHTGRPLNGKRTPLVHTIRTVWNDDLSEVEIRSEGREPVTYRPGEDPARAEEYLSAHFGRVVRLLRSAEPFGAPDDTELPGPTLVSRATIEETSHWFSHISVEEMRRRLRTNLELVGVEPFYEDALYGTAGESVLFRLGDVAVEGRNPCRRCVVPSRDSRTGEVTPDFKERFMRKREETLPSRAERSRFDTFYRLTLNTRIPPSEYGKTLRVGDVLTLPDRVV